MPNLCDDKEIYGKMNVMIKSSKGKVRDEMLVDFKNRPAEMMELYVQP